MRIEEESNRAFTSALPSAWVPRRQEPDYGIDFIVEIFEDGRSTGLSFNAQLKGTDEDLKAALGSLRLGRDKVEDYSSLDLPTLIVRYHAPSGQLFARWFHSYDPQVETGKPPKKEEPQSIAFRFSEADGWTDATTGEIIKSVQGFRRFRQAEHQLPLPLVVGENAELETSHVAAELRQVLEGAPGIIAVEHRQPGTGDAQLKIEPDQLRVSLADVASATVHFDGEQTPEWLGINAGMALAVALTTVGQTNLAAQIASAIGERGSLWSDPGCCMILAGAFYRARRLREALEVSDRLDQSDNEFGPVVAYMLLSVLLAYGSDLSSSDATVAEEVQMNRYQRRLDREDRNGAAAEAYNLAMLLKRLRKNAESKEWFERAVELDPSYEERDYFHSDLAGILFTNDETSEAADHYVKAVELGAQGMVPALAADCLLFSGRYQEALARFEDYLSRNDAEDPDDAEWRLKKSILPELIKVGGAKQDRQPEAARQEVEPIDFVQGRNMSEEEAFARIDRVLTLDACCHWAWFSKALLLAALADDPAQGITPGTIAALVNLRSVEAWGNAIRFADPGDESRLLDLLRVGLRLMKTEFERNVLETAEFVGGDHASTLRRLLESAIRERSHAVARTGFTMRYPGQNGKMEEISVEPPAAAPPSGQ